LSRDRAAVEKSLHCFHEQATQPHLGGAASPPDSIQHHRLPTCLRDAIPDLHGGRVLKLDSVTAGVSRAEFFGDHIQLNLIARETSPLHGEFVVRVDLLPEAARTLAETLTRLADEVEEPGGPTA
jgi:hypothetical protein